MALLSDNAEQFLKLARDEALASLSEGGVPVGAVLVADGKVLSRGRNRTVQTGDPTAHAELECIRNAGTRSSYKNVILYSTIVPCHMCTGALVQFGIEFVVAGDGRNYRGASSMLKDHWIQVEHINDEACISMLADFIKEHPDRWRKQMPPGN